MTPIEPKPPCPQSPAAPGSASFPAVDYTASDFHFTINFTVWMGGASICFCDREDRAKLVARAFNHWLQSDDARKWWDEITQKPNVVFSDPAAETFQQNQKPK